MPLDGTSLGEKITYAGGPIFPPIIEPEKPRDEEPRRGSTDYKNSAACFTIWAVATGSLAPFAPGLACVTFALSITAMTFADIFVDADKNPQKKTFGDRAHAVTLATLAGLVAVTTGIGAIAIANPDFLKAPHRPRYYPNTEVRNALPQLCNTNQPLIVCTR